MIAIWEKLFFKLRVSFDGLIIRKEVFSESSHLIERNLDMVKEYFVPDRNHASYS